MAHKLKFVNNFFLEFCILYFQTPGLQWVSETTAHETRWAQTLLHCSGVIAFVCPSLTHHHTLFILCQTYHTTHVSCLSSSAILWVSSSGHSVIVGIWLTQASKKPGRAASCVSVAPVHPAGRQESTKSSQTNELWACSSEQERIWKADNWSLSS